MTEEKMTEEKMTEEQMTEEQITEEKITENNNGTSLNESSQISQPRWKSPALWISVLGLIGLILSATGLLEKIGLNENEWDNIITAVGGVLCAFGIVNNPTCSNKV